MEVGTSQHGILCGEVIHALAPDAELLLATWEQERPDQFLAAVRWARGRGARIISCSVITPTWSDYGGHGPIHAELQQALGDAHSPGAILFFACAGNIAQRHWAGAFSDDGHGWHLWGRREAGRDNRLHPWGTERVSVELSNSRGAYEVQVVDADSGEVVSSGRGPANTQGAPLPHAVAGLRPEVGRRYALRVRCLAASSGPFHVVVLGGGLEIASARESIPFPGDGAEVVTVGAVDRGGARCAYSSCGEEHSGKPDLVAHVPFPSGWRSRPFGGTSAATPQAAAAAALIWARHPAWTASQVRECLRREAVPLAPAAAPWETGAGCLHLSPVHQGTSRD
jgi:subtilisin family serine protease